MSSNLTTLGTGAAPQRGARSSQLLFGWQSRYRSLLAYTGQQAAFELISQSTARTITGRNGTNISAGHAMPRWEQTAATGTIARLALESNAGNDGERLSWPWPLNVMSLSVFLRVYPYFAVAADWGVASYAMQMGVTTVGGGGLLIGRSGTSWTAIRQRPATTSLTSAFVEPAGVVYPIDLLATLSAAGQVNLTTRDSAATPVIRSASASATDSNMVLPGELWGSSIMYWNSGTDGGRWRYETVKVARGVQTFASMDLLF